MPRIDSLHYQPPSSLLINTQINIICTLFHFYFLNRWENQVQFLRKVKELFRSQINYYEAGGVGGGMEYLVCPVLFFSYGLSGARKEQR